MPAYMYGHPPQPGEFDWGYPQITMYGVVQPGGTDPNPAPQCPPIIYPQIPIGALPDTIGGQSWSWWIRRLSQIAERDIDLVKIMVEKFAAMEVGKQEKKE